MPTSLMLSLAATKPSPDPTKFYEVAATIIPVLFLGLVYQAQFHQAGQSSGPVVRYFVGALAVTFSVIAEWAALKVLIRGYPTVTDHSAVDVGLLCLGAFVVVDPLIWAGRGAAELSIEIYLRRHSDERAAWTTDRHARRARWVTSSLFCLVLVLAIFFERNS